MCYSREDTSTLFGAQCPNRLHRRDPHGEEGRIECSFDLLCHRLAEIIGALLTVYRNSHLPKKNGKIGNISHRGDFFMFIPHRRLDKFFITPLIRKF